MPFFQNGRGFVEDMIKSFGVFFSVHSVQLQLLLRIVIITTELQLQLQLTHVWPAFTSCFSWYHISIIFSL